MKIRDTQRKRVYDAEAQVYDHISTIADGDLQAFVDSVLAKAAVQSRWGQRSMKVQRGAGGASAHVHSIDAKIHLGPNMRSEWVILHEIAHHLTPLRFADHGPEFVGVYLFLVKTVLGTEEANRLRKAFREQRVRLSLAGIPAANSHPVVSAVQRKRNESLKAKIERLSEVHSKIPSYQQIAEAKWVLEQMIPVVPASERRALRQALKAIEANTVTVLEAKSSARRDLRAAQAQV